MLFEGDLVLGKDEIEGCVVAKADDARLSLTQSDDPLSGGHLALGVSKTPPRPSRERSGVVVDVVHPLKVADCKHIGPVVKGRSPIPNGLTAVGGAKTRLGIYKIRHGFQRHGVLPTCLRV